ncbi:MAG: diguanylate cyclase [Thauera sp.]|nr:diguanylate cyclase [Thauera sp.]
MPKSIDIKRYEQLKGSGELPSPRGVALAIIRMTQSEDVSMGELARVIKGDPAFVGRLIKAANGAFATERRAIVSVQEALMVLGLPAVRTMALGFSLLSSYRKGTCAAFDYNRFWASSVLMALAMQALAHHVRAMAADEAFSIGLLARIGELALATIYPVEYSRILQESGRAPRVRLADLETSAFAVNHAELGAAMLADWGVPRIATNAVLCYEQSSNSGPAEDSREHGVIQMLALSRAIAQLCLSPEAEQAGLMLPMLRLAARLGMSRETFVGACERVGRSWGEWSRLLQLESTAAPRFDALAGGGESGETAATVAVEAPDAGESEQPREEAGLAPLRVLIVASDGAERLRLRELLQADGMAVFDAEGLGAGLESIVDVQPHLMLVDWQLPDGRGADMVRNVRRTRLGRGVLTLLLLPSEDESVIAEAVDAGVDEFVARPVRPHVLAARLRAGRRMVALQHEVQREREEIRRFAAELAITNRRLEEVAMTDALTGFPNRRYALDRMKQEWVAATRSQRPLSAMVVDLDDLKRVNDAYGHDVGDMALRQAADVLRGVLRAQDVICRTGGDEFLVICPDTEHAAALLCAERLRVAVERLVIETGGAQLRLTVSIGVAVRDRHMNALEALIKAADRGAYVAKQAGRNRVSTVQGEVGAG